jgi:alkyl hydroperoxide reductase subunit F
LPPELTIYTTPACHYCGRLKQLLRERGVHFTEIDVASDQEGLAEMRRRTGKAYVPQIFIGDEYVGGYDDFLIKDAMGQIDELLGVRREKKEKAGGLYDLIIIGGGPAGLTAAVYAARKYLKTLLVADELGGQPLVTAGIENYMGYQYITGPELMAKFAEQASQFEIDIQVGDPITGFKLDGDIKVVTDAEGKVYRGRTVVIATGKRSRKLDVPGESQFSGCGVSYCSTCDGPLFAGKPVVVAGGGNSAMQSALEMAAISPDVFIVSRTEFTGDEVLKRKVLAQERIRKRTGWQPVEIKGDSCVKTVVIEKVDGGEREEIEASAVFVEVGLTPNSEFAAEVLPLNERGEIVVDCDCRTGLPGIFSAGDVTQVRDKQIVVAAGEGAKAALSAHDYLMTHA